MKRATSAGSRRAFVLASALACGLGLAAPSAHAEDGESALPAPPLALSVTPGTGGGPWKLKIENTGDVPVRITADARLLALEVMPPAGFVDPTTKKGTKPKPVGTVRCVLPDDARPASDEGHELVIPSKRSWSMSFDPLHYCFGAKERATLVTGAVVNPRFGWPTPAPKPGSAAARASTRAKKPIVPTPPFVVSPVGAAVGKLAAAKELQGTSATLAENVTIASASPAPTSSPAPPASSSSSSPGGLTVSMPAALDVLRGNEISATVTVANEGDKAAIILFRAETLKLMVAGPAGTVSCGGLRSIDAPIRELYTTLGVKGRTSLAVLITSLCPTDTFDKPGIYRVTPTFDMTNASARSIGLKTWDGSTTADTPMLLRVRAERRPSTDTARPALD